MSNIFKQNSRFGALAEESSTTKDFKKNNNNNNNNNNKINEARFKGKEDKGNSFKQSFNDRPHMNYNNGYQRNSLTNRESKESIERRALEEKLKKEEEEKIQSERIAKVLSNDNFPTLGKKENKNITETNNNSFLERLKN